MADAARCARQRLLRLRVLAIAAGAVMCGGRVGGDSPRGRCLAPSPVSSQCLVPLLPLLPGLCSQGLSACAAMWLRCACPVRQADTTVPTVPTVHSSCTARGLHCSCTARCTARVALLVLHCSCR